ncbi:hypothetical protein SAICODRAFT_28685 [Saitoella complicata NRRL Y-17804]|uniref:uncharacterized protein n=1 Tax=Saitoella complicata (strain BCRC 22490 / CBS 7301 / JCM 7358 / NBRC 10748 / NRRL Y-17804) TaxID=698492 RepID=UPI00086754DD|nr:uncharacterized protein SAICODRAFT_28685 [Saitoella complicata NRRL Y-17804]ODQ56622.1 hypothetical protein SAICODRAFT_28685 [Saitoella complicata NRRL Y-17804]
MTAASYSKASDRPITFQTLGTTILYGCIAGAIGVGVMTAGEKIEQLISSRPDSYVPAHTLERLLGLPDKPDSERWGLNHVMHYGQGACAGALRALMSLYGIRGPFANFIFTCMRLCVDQTLENLTGVGAPPWTWPVYEQWIDVLHKGVYAFATGYITDTWFPGQWVVIDGDKR